MVNISYGEVESILRTGVLGGDTGIIKIPLSYLQKNKELKRYSKLHSEDKLQYESLWYQELKKSQIDQYLSAKGIYLKWKNIFY